MAPKPDIDDVIAGALFDFVGHVATTPEFMFLVGELRAELDKWAQDRDLELLDADVLHWELNRQRLRDP